MKPLGAKYHRSRRKQDGCSKQFIFYKDLSANLLSRWTYISVTPVVPLFFHKYIKGGGDN